MWRCSNVPMTADSSLQFSLPQHLVVTYLNNINHIITQNIHFTKFEYACRVLGYGPVDGEFNGQKSTGLRPYILGVRSN